jgi:PAS domain S-box-containing protein
MVDARSPVPGCENERLQALATYKMATAIADAIVCVRGDGTITFWNRGAETLFGYSRAEAIGQKLDIIIPGQLHA